MAPNVTGKSHAAPKWRWHHLSLRALICTLALVCCTIALLRPLQNTDVGAVNHATSAEQSIVRLRQRGFAVSVPFGTSGNVESNVHAITELDDERQVLHAVSALRESSQEAGVKQGATSMSNIRRQHQVFVLDQRDVRRGFPLTSREWEDINSIEGVQALSLHGGITDEDLVHLAGHDRLSWLSLADCQLTGTGIAHMTCGNSLTHLDMSRVPLSAAGCRAIAESLPSLKQLRITCGVIHNNGWNELARSSSLSTLLLTDHKARGDWSTHVDIIEFPSLEYLLLDTTCKQWRLTVKECPRLRAIGRAPFQAAFDCPSFQALSTHIELLPLASSIDVSSLYVRIREVPALKRLRVRECRELVTGELPALEELTYLGNTRPDFGVSGLGKLGHCPRLRTLIVSCDRMFSDDLMARIADRCPQMSRLALLNCPGITDDTVARLASMQVDTLDLAGTSVTEYGVLLAATIPTLKRVRFPDEAHSSALYRFAQLRPDVVIIAKGEMEPWIHNAWSFQ